MEIQETPVFIKPEGLRREKEIVLRIERFSHIAFLKWVELDADMISVIYPYVSKSLWFATLEHLFKRKVLVMVLKGANIVPLAFDMIGKETNPEDCGLHTLRLELHRKEKLTPKLLADGSTVYYWNYLHRARTPEEAKVQIKALLNGSYHPSM